MKDLWPKDIRTEPQEVAPVRILNQQALFLRKKTSNIVQAEVVQLPHTSSTKYSVEYHFDLRAPAWGGYRYTLFRFFTNVLLYPVVIVVGKDLSAEVGRSLLGEAIEINSRNELEEILEKIFAAPKTIEIIKALIIQSGAELAEPAGEEEPVNFRRTEKPSETASDFIQE